jgi:hypothetical protein
MPTARHLSSPKVTWLGRHIVTAVALLLLAAGTAASQEPAPAGGVGGTYTPPACEGLFTDVPCTAQFAAWVEQLSRDSITSGCASGLYCPDSAVTRRQMSVFLERAMRGTSGWPPHTVLVFAVRNADGSPNPTASGQALRDGIASIPTSGADTPSADNPWLVKVGPGVFDTGTSTFQLKDYVSLEGSGQHSTILASASTTSSTCLYLGESSEVRSLTVRRTSDTSGTAIAIRCYDNPGVRLEQVTAEASGGVTWNTGVSLHGCPDTRLVHVTSHASGGTYTYGVTSTVGDLTIVDSDITAEGASTFNYGMQNTSATTVSKTIDIEGSRITAAGHTVSSDSHFVINIASSRLSGGPVLGGTRTCAGVWDETLTFYPSTCPP